MGVVSSNGNHKNINHEVFNIAEPRMFCPLKIIRYTHKNFNWMIELKL